MIALKSPIILCLKGNAVNENKKWNQEDVLEVLSQHDIFSTLDANIIKQISVNSSVRSLIKGEYLIQQGVPTENAIYLLLSGEVEVLEDTQSSVVINTLKSNIILGENILFKETERLVSIRAKSNIEVLVLSCEVINKLIEKDCRSMLPLIQKLHLQTLNHLKQINQAARKLIDSQREIGFFIISIVSFLSIYSLLTPILQTMATQIQTTYISTALIAVGMIFLIARMVAVGSPLSRIGITKHNLEKSIIESCLLALFILLIIVLLKYLILYFATLFGDKLLFYPGLKKKILFYTYPQRMYDKYGIVLTQFEVFTFVVLYAIHAFFQELLARGSLQGMFKRFLPFKNNDIPAIFLASLIFSAAHVYHSVGAVFSVFLPGLFLGWLYARQGNIFGVALFHIIAGVGFFLFIG